MVGRYALTGRFTNTLEVSGQSPQCGAPGPEAALAGNFAIYRNDGGLRIVEEGPGCTTQVRPGGGDRVYIGDGATCVIDPKGAYHTLGVSQVRYRSFVLDLAALRWSYDVELTWPSTEFSDGVAKVCGHGEATLARLPAGP